MKNGKQFIPKADKEIFLPTSRRVFWRCLALSSLFALSPLLILLMGEIATGKPSPYSWLWFVIPVSLAGLIVWFNRPSTLVGNSLTIVDFALRSSQLTKREIPLAGIQRVELRRGLVDLVFGLSRLCIRYSGKLRYEIAGLAPDDARRGLAFIDHWRQRYAGNQTQGRLLTKREWRSVRATGGWRQIYAESTGLRIFEMIQALSVFALGVMGTGSVMIVGIDRLHAPHMPSWDIVRKAYWGYVIVLPVLILVPAILGSMLVYGWRHVVDLLTPAVTYRGFLERKYSGSSTRMQLHFIGSGPWDWQLPGRHEHAKLVLRDEILVRFRRRSQVAVEICVRAQK